MEVKLASNTVSDLAPMPDYLSAEKCPRASDHALRTSAGTAILWFYFHLPEVGALPES